MPEVPSSPYSYGLGLKYLSVDSNDLASSPLPQTRLAEAETFSICVLHRCSKTAFQTESGKQKMIRLNRCIPSYQYKNKKNKMIKERAEKERDKKITTEKDDCRNGRN